MKLSPFGAVAATLLLALAGCGGSKATFDLGAGQSSTAVGWSHYQSSVTEDGHSAEIEYWVEGEAVVRQYRQDGVLLYDERCVGNRLSIREMRPSEVEGKPAFNYKEESDRDSAATCFDSATHEELRYLRGRLIDSQPEAVKLADGRSGLRWVGASGHEFVVDAATKLPARLSYGSEESGGLTTIAFSPFSVEANTAPPVAPEVDWTGYQDTSNVEPMEAGRALGLSEVPTTVAGLALRHSWSYRTQNLSLPTYYLIWGDDSVNIQAISTAATLPEELRGFSSDHTEYDRQDGTRHFKVGTIGGDAILVRRALQQLAPAALEDTRVHVSDPNSALSQ